MPSTGPFDGPIPGSPEAWGRLGKRLRDASYLEEPITHLLGTREITDLAPERHPFLEDRLDAGALPDDLVRFFLLGLPLPRARAAGALGDEGLALLESARAVGPAPLAEEVCAHAGLFPCLDALVFADHRSPPTPALAPPPGAEPVMSPGQDTCVLARSIPRRPIGAALDLCTGTGVQAILMARHAEEVVAVDASPRALRCARINAMLNGVHDRIALIQGDLDRALRADRRFDLVAANPPFVPTPAQGLLYRDGGPLGDDILRTVVSALPQRLARGGTAYVVTHIARRDGDDGRRRLGEWLRGGDLSTPLKAGLSAIIFQFGSEEPESYILAQLLPLHRKSPERYASEVRRWLDHYRFHGIVDVVGALVAFFPTEGRDVAPWVSTVAAVPPHGPAGAAVEAAVRDVSRARGVLFPDEIASVVPQPAPGADLVVTRPIGKKGALDRSFSVRRRRGSQDEIRVEALDVDREVRAVLELLDGQRTVAEIVDAYAALRHRPPEGARGFVTRALLELLVHGVVRL